MKEMTNKQMNIIIGILIFAILAVVAVFVFVFAHDMAAKENKRKEKVAVTEELSNEESTNTKKVEVLKDKDETKSEDIEEEKEEIVEQNTEQNTEQNEKRLEELKSILDVEYDEVNQITLVSSNDTIEYLDGNERFTFEYYIGETDDKQRLNRFSTGFFRREGIYFDMVKLLADDKVYMIEFDYFKEKYVDIRMQGLVEMIDISIDKDIMEKVANAKVAKIQFYGNIRKSYIISEKQKQSVKHVLEYEKLAY